MLSTELDVLKKVRHRNIVSMHDLFESKDAVYIVADLASGGELFQQLLDKGSYTEKDASNLVKQILDGVAYLHERDVSKWFIFGFRKGKEGRRREENWKRKWEENKKAEREGKEKRKNRGQEGWGEKAREEVWKKERDWWKSRKE